MILPADATASAPADPLPPRLFADTSARGFAVGIYLEHLEEASFLHDQRLALLDDPELPWPDVEDYEDRLEAHLDALVLGGELALAVCRQQSEEGDAGELHAALRVYCRQRRLDLLGEALHALDPTDEDRVRAATRAVAEELPPEWQHELQRLLRGDAAAQRVAARVLGFRRAPVGAEILAQVADWAPEATADLVWALGRLRDRAAYRPLSKLYLESEDRALRSAAALALLRIGEGRVVRACLMRPTPTDLLTVGLGGSRADVPTLLEIAARGDAGPDGILALGLLGDASAVSLLLDALSDAELAASAATALDLITGAGLYAEVLVPEEEDEEPEGAEPAGAEPTGSTLLQLVADPAVWREWWQESAGRFSRGVRYRGGEPYAPGALVATLLSPGSRRSARQLVSEELVIRYGIDLGFEAELTVAEQRRVLGEYAQWEATGGRALSPGWWYLAGQPCAS